MRADRHYVDQLAASSGQPVRLIPTAEIDGASVDAAGVQPLIESIRRHGIVQPLLIGRSDNRYDVIAGRKRLLAAKTLQLRVVPCLVHDVSKAEAVALAAADNLHTSAAESADAVDLAGLSGLLASHLAGIRQCVELCDARTPLNAAALDLLQAHAWRASRLLDALNLAHNAPISSQESPLLPVLADVVHGFATESRSSGVEIRVEAPDDALPAFNAAGVIAGVSGALFAILPLVANVAHPLVTIRPTTSTGADLTIQIAQNSTPVPRRIAAHFFDADPSRLGGVAAAVGALAAKALAHAYGGKAVFEAQPNGCRLSIFMTRPS